MPALSANGREMQSGVDPAHGGNHRLDIRDRGRDGFDGLDGLDGQLLGATGATSSSRNTRSGLHSLGRSIWPSRSAWSE